jgi:hypothetical protein
MAGFTSQRQNMLGARLMSPIDLSRPNRNALSGQQAQQMQHGSSYGQTTPQGNQTIAENAENKRKIAIQEEYYRLQTEDPERFARLPPLPDLMREPSAWQGAMAPFTGPDANQNASNAITATLGSQFAGGLIPAAKQIQTKGIMSLLDPRMSGQLNTFAGTGAETANKEAFDLAESMKMAGATDDEILQATAKLGQPIRTGFPDGMPRFEIDDSGAAFTPSNLPNYAGNGRDGAYGAGSASELLPHDALYGAYPSLQNTRAINYESPSVSGNSGQYSGAIGMSPETITIKGGGKSTTLHELQHAIQQREGFARGGSPEALADGPIGEAKARVAFLNKELSRVAKEMDAVTSTYGQAKRGKEDTYRALKEEYDATQEAKAALWKESTANPYDTYKRLAGEAEARLVQSRMNLTADQRLAEPITHGSKYGFDVPEADQIVRRGDGVQQSLPTDEASRMARAREMGFDVDAYHGSNRLDRVLEKPGLDQKRATSGPMPFFTDDTELASSYAKNKVDTSRMDASDGGFGEWFKIKPKGARTEKNFDQAWNYLSPEEKRSATDAFSRVGYVDDEYTKIGVSLDNVGGASRDHWEYTLKDNNGNAYAAAQDLWLNSGQLHGEEDRFMEVLNHAGIKGAKFDSPHMEAAGVLPAKLRIQKPFETTPENMQSVLPAIKQAAKRKRGGGYGVDQWDKRSVSGADFVRRIEDDIKNGTTHAWTSIPDWATEALKKEGYDGIKDLGGKGGGPEHTVWIPFDPSQVRSKFAAFDPAKKDSANLMHGIGGLGAGGLMSQDEQKPKRTNALRGY